MDDRIGVARCLQGQVQHREVDVGGARPRRVRSFAVVFDRDLHILSDDATTELAFERRGAVRETSPSESQRLHPILQVVLGRVYAQLTRFDQRDPIGEALDVRELMGRQHDGSSSNRSNKSSASASSQRA